MNHHCIPGLTITSVEELLFGSVRETVKTMHTGFSAYTYCIMPTLAHGADTGRNRTL